MSDYTFPVERILHAVQESLPRMHTIGLSKEMETGLKNSIQLVDRDGAHTTIADVSPCGQVTLSLSYCQFLLLLCHIGLIVHESIVIANEIEQMSDSERKMFHMALTTRNSLTIFLKEIPDYNSAICYCSHLIDIAKPLLTNAPITDDEFRAIANVDYDSTLATKANALCVYGIDFILLHEASHVLLGQDLYSKGTVVEEIEADHNAFWTMFNDLDGIERNTALMGCICALASLLFYNPSLASDGVHPREDVRLFEFYDILKNENSSYTEMLVIILSAWATTFRIDNFPSIDGSYGEIFIKQREYFNHMSI